MSEAPEPPWERGARRFLHGFGIAMAAFVALLFAMLLWLLVPPLLAAIWAGDRDTLGLYAIGAVVIGVLVAVQMAGEAVLGFVFRPVFSLLRRSKVIVSGATAIMAVIGIVLLIALIGFALTTALA